MIDIETKQIISWLRDKADRADNPSWTRMMQMAADRLQELDRDEDEWISVKEMKPKRNGYYLVCTKNEFYQTNNIAKASFRNGAFYGQGGCWPNVTHWMPLPKEPKGE